MIGIKVDVRGIGAAKAHIAGLGKQVAFAASKALNATGKAVADAMPAEIERALDRPTPFTKRGVRVLKYANKARLEATVGFMRAQAEYMRWQIEGGSRQPGTEGLRLPAAIKVNEFGNIPKGIIRQLVAVARKERRLGKVKARRIAVSREVELFYGDPIDKTGKTWPRGIYKATRNALVPLVVFPVTPARYRAIFDFPRIAEGIVKREWSRQFDKAMDEALRTAR
ncbi:MAG: hypothetical protein ACRC1H_00910 [Caldilineaceae bacterium]